MSISDDRTVSDELLSAAVRDTTAELNQALGAAYQAGLMAFVHTDGVREIGHRASLVIVQVTVSRPL